MARRVTNFTAACAAAADSVTQNKRGVNKPKKTLTKRKPKSKSSVSELLDAQREHEDEDGESSSEAPAPARRRPQGDKKKKKKRVLKRTVVRRDAATGELRTVMSEVVPAGTFEPALEREVPKPIPRVFKRKPPSEPEPSSPEETAPSPPEHEDSLSDSPDDSDDYMSLSPPHASPVPRVRSPSKRKQGRGVEAKSPKKRLDSGWDQDESLKEMYERKPLFQRPASARPTSAWNEKPPPPRERSTSAKRQGVGRSPKKRRSAEIDGFDCRETTTHDRRDTRGEDGRWGRRARAAVEGHRPEHGGHQRSEREASPPERRRSSSAETPRPSDLGIPPPPPPP
eukprot:Hpha_TRINITY_DN16464_c3_g1::TRINITY_DN16464_c3_g1_i1::g.162142::m.162142